ncbi:MAG: ATP-binding protein [Chitinophagaceae bacterium]
MNILKQKGLAVATTVYWFFLVYIIAALIWWFIALQRQNNQITSFKLSELSLEDPSYLQKAASILNADNSKSVGYLGEGGFFLLFTIVSAVFVYRAVGKEFKLNQQQQNFMMAITHELKTPIAITKLNIETIQKHKLDEAKQQKLLQMTLQEIERLNLLANNILVSAQLEEGRYAVSREELDLSLLAAGCVNDFVNRFPGNHWNIDIQDEIVLHGDTLLLQIMINNLLENAIKYSSKESSIWFSLAQVPNGSDLHVIDEGPGIPAEERAKIFERFYRIGNESIRKTKGTGLGLYLCKKIASDHKADIHVENRKTGGSDFRIHFRT